MSRFFSEKYRSLIPYTPGEQPQGRKYIKLNTNESPFPPSPLAIRFAREQAETLRLYSDPECGDLIKTACAALGVSKDAIIFTNGSDEILNFAFMAFCDEAHPAAFPDVTYGFYSVFAELNHVPYAEIPVGDDFSVRVEDYIGIGKTVFLANPNAPTGLALTLPEIERIVQSNPDHVVIIDEAYVDFGAQSAIKLVQKYDHLLVVQTFSKSRSMAGARLGFAVGDPALIRDLNTIRFSTNPYNVNRMTMAAGVGALTDRAYFERNCSAIRENRAWTAERLRALGFSFPDSKANFLFAKHKTFGGKELYLRLKENGILVRHFETGRLRDYNRITVGSMEDMQTLIRTLNIILEEQS